MEFSGRIEAFPPGDLLQWAKNERRSGALVLRRSDREKRIYFLSGMVVACFSNDPAEYFGQHLLLRGAIDETQLFKALTHCTRHNARLGSALTELGILSEDAVQVALREQIEDLIYDLFLWEHGIFYFQSEMPTDDEILPQPIDTMGLVLEGTRWVDEKARMRSVFVHDNVVLRRGKNYPGKNLSPLGKRILEAVDGKKTLKELYQATRGSHFRFLEAAFALCVDETLDIEDVGEPFESGTFQLSVLDLLLERAAEEQTLIARRHMAVPLDLLERWVPVWVGEPNDEERTRMPTRARDFYARLDGQTPLAQAFSGDVRLRGREMDLLLHQMQKGRLAILPAPVADLERIAEERGEPALRRWWRRITSGPT
jgi:Domain of unknown function (DUF4388)